MMNKYFFIIMIFIPVFYSLCVYSQQQEKYIYEGKDSVYRYRGIVPPVEFQYNLNEIFSKPLTLQLPDETLFDDNPSTIWLRTRLAISHQYFQFEGDEFDFHLTSPLYEQYLRESQIDMVQYVLGMVQTGAVAYMAYRHIKKYGFWK
jgi:hypothetical protein